MEKKVEFFKKHKRHSQHKPTQIDSLDYSKESLTFNIAVIGYTLKANLHANYKDIEKTFFNQINTDSHFNNGHSDITKQYNDIAEEFNVKINLLSDDDPHVHYECGKANGVSTTSDACLMLYDPIQAQGLGDLDAYFRNLLYNRKRWCSEPGIFFFIGINQDKPEQHRFTKNELLSRITAHTKDNLYLYQISLDTSSNSAENIETIIKNLAIVCLQKYQQVNGEEITITSAITPIAPISFNPLEIVCEVYSTLMKARNRLQGIYGLSVPKEITAHITFFLLELFFKEDDNSTFRLAMYKELFLDKTADLSKQLATNDTSNESLIIEKPRKPKSKCAMM